MCLRKPASASSVTTTVSCNIIFGHVETQDEFKPCCSAAPSLRSLIDCHNERVDRLFLHTLNGERLLAVLGKVNVWPQ